LLKKLGITPQALSSRVNTVKKHHAITTEDAVYTIAFEEGIDISKRLDPETLERVNRYAASRKTADPSPRSNKIGSKRRSAQVTIAGVNVDNLPGMYKTHAEEAKFMAEKVYPILYVFENSARDIISRVLEAALGTGWWDEISWSEARAKVKRRMQVEGDEAWHSKRGDNPLHYLDITDLAELVRKPKAWPHFKSLFPRDNWFDGVVDDLNVSRRVIAHMNPLSASDVRQVEAGFTRWANQIAATASRIP
jgi:hypothetical protein